MRRPGGAAARALSTLGVVLAAVLLPPSGSGRQLSEGGLRIELVPLEGKQHAVVVQGLDPAVLARLQASDPGLEGWRQILTVRVATGPSREAPPLLGAYESNGETLVFTPRFPLKPGLRYRATFTPSALPGGGAGDDVVTREIGLPAQAPPTPETRVQGIYPSSDVLPENLLRFYIQFSAPMRQGESYRFVHLRELGGNEVELPFLELAEELWDRSGQRLTLLLDPGRIKRGLVPHDEVGLALAAGRPYVLAVDREWRDARGAPLMQGFQKEFRVEEPDRVSPAPADWELLPPRAGTREPLRLGFPEPLDHALLHRMIWIEDGSGQVVAGAVETVEHETGWVFVPDRPWRADLLRVRVDPALEDLAGNGVGRPFEVMADGSKDTAGSDGRGGAESPVDLEFSPGAP